MAAPMKITFGPCCRQMWGLSRRLVSTQTTSSHGDTSLPPSAIPISHTPRMLCRTSESDPAKHRLDQEGLFYTVPPELQDKFFLSVPKRIRKMRSAFNETAIMVRKPAVEVIQHLKNANYDFPVNRYVLYGDVGNGKTTTLEHVLHYCYTQGWIIGHLPWPKEYNMSYGDQMYVVPSTYKPGRVDLPMRGVQWLTNFMKINNERLKDITIENHYVWTKRDSAEVGEPLLKAIDFGINRPKYATDVVGLVVKELKAAAITKKLKLLFVVDGVNAFWEPSTTKKEENPREKYNIEDFSLVHNFKKLLKNDWSNGAVLCTVDSNAQMEPNPSNTLPQGLLGPQGFAHLEPFLPIHVPRYSDKEIRCAIEYLYDRRWFSTAPSELAKKEIIFLSQCNGRELMKVTAMWQ